MHTARRFVSVLVVLALLAVLLPLGIGMQAMLTLDARWKVADTFQDALTEAAGSYRTNAGLTRIGEHAEKTIADLAPRERELREQKRTLRHRARGLRRVMQQVGERYDVDFSAPAAARNRLEAEKKYFLAFLKDARAAGYDTAMSAEAVRLALHGSPLGPSQAFVATDIRAQRMQMIEELSAGLRAAEEFAAVRGTYATLLNEYSVVAPQITEARATLEETKIASEEIQAILRDVHEQVLRLQGELQRIDARLRTKAERALIERGLLPPKQGTNGTGESVRPVFLWPAYGAVSAGFRNEAYFDHFGVAHEGVDIVVPQGSPVMSAADGVVFLVRDGGAKGYTYVLIGHRGGYATLYGHLSAVGVRAGQEVDAGEVIGVSGGQPGTSGSGPMTTGPHLHFEVIRGGGNVDPEGVLP